jgi:hypothetical protein
VLRGRKCARRECVGELVLEPSATKARPLTPVERDRLHQRYVHLTGRSVALGYASLGVVVKAATPEELLAATYAVIEESTRRQAPS